MKAPRHATAAAPNLWYACVFRWSGSLAPIVRLASPFAARTTTTFRKQKRTGRCPASARQAINPHHKPLSIEDLALSDKRRRPCCSCRGRMLMSSNDAWMGAFGLWSFRHGRHSCTARHCTLRSSLPTRKSKQTTSPVRVADQRI